MEKWKNIKEYEGRYMISNYGNVYSVIRKRNLKRCIVGRYTQVTLHHDTLKAKTFRIHRLVGDYFVDGREYDHELNHKDGDRYNNHWLNLEWTTHHENILHSHNKGMTKRLLRKILLDTQTGVYYESISEAAKYSRFKKGNISNMLAGISDNRTNLIVV